MLVTNFKTYVQLIYDVTTDAFVSAELLARPSAGKLDIENFFKNVDTSSLTAWFEQQVTESILFKQQTNISAHVNIDKRTIIEDKDIVLQSINDPENEHLILEITQVQGLPEKECFRKFSNKIKCTIKFALDDFIFDCMNYTTLREHEFDVIKIDRSVIHEANTNYTVQKNLIQLQHDFDAEFIVEGVETHNDVELMKSLGFTKFQGYFYHKPQPLNDVIAFLKSS